MVDKKHSFARSLLSEIALFSILLLAGLVLLPLAIYMIGNSLFGDYSGSGFSSFYATIHSEMRSGRPAAWLLVLSPYIVWQLFRLTWRGFSWASRGKPEIAP